MNRYNTITAALKYNIIDTFGGMDAIEKILLTGIVESASIPQSYCHMPDEIKNELLSAGFMDIHLVSVEGIANATSNNTLPKNEKNIELLLRCIELTESVPELLGVSRNIIAVGKKPLY